MPMSNKVNFIRSDSITGVPLFFEVINNNFMFRKIETLEKAFYSRCKEMQVDYFNMISLLELLNIIELKHSSIKKGRYYNDVIVNSKQSIYDSLIMMIIKYIIENDIIEKFLPQESVHFDEIALENVIDNSLIPLRFSQLRNVLISFGFFISRGESNYFEISKRFQDYFNSVVLQEIFKDSLIDEKVITANESQIQSIINRNNENAELAEDYVLSFEKNRLVGHNDIDKIIRVSLINKYADFDIFSFDDSNSRVLNRYIEVKSYSGDVHFYWTNNEVKKAKDKGEMYYIYLVDIAAISNSNYFPTIINDPYKKFFINKEWKNECQKWLFYE